MEKNKKKRTMLDTVIRYLILTVSSFVYSAAIALFIDPNNLAPGGVTGVAIILNRILGVETGTLILLINVPILFLGAWKFGIRFIASTVYCILLSSAVTNLLSGYEPLTKEVFPATLAGSCLLAASLGIIFKSGSTTGGTDIIVKVLRLKYPHLKTSSLYLILDACVVALSYVVFRDTEITIYSGVAVFLSSVVMDLVLYGKDEAKLIYIISDHSKQITVRLLKELDIGVTHLTASGGYSKKEKNVIMCAVKKQMAPGTEEIVKQEDPQAFMIVTSATEIYGKGYKSYFKEKV